MKMRLLIASFAFINFFIDASATEMASLKLSKNDKNSSDINFVRKKKSDLYIISSKHINRIITPFEQPSLKMDSITDLQYKTSNNVIYFATPTSMQGRILAGFITEKGSESNAIRFMFRPEPIPPQEITLVANSYSSDSINRIAKRFESSHPRQLTITTVLKTLAFQKLPEGYVLTAPSSQYLPQCHQKGLEFDFFRGQLVSGGDYVVAIGTVKNTTKDRVEFSERSCYSENVVAISAYPKIILLANEASEVFVMFYKKKVQNNKKIRQSLIRG